MQGGFQICAAILPDVDILFVFSIGFSIGFLISSYGVVIDVISLTLSS